MMAKIKHHAGLNVCPLIIRDMISKEVKEDSGYEDGKIPSLRFIYNTVARSVKLDGRTGTNGELINWLTGKLTTTREQYDEVKNDSTLIYTHIFDGENIQHDINPSQGTCKGYCYTSKRMLHNLQQSMSSRDRRCPGIPLTFDGTYKLLKNNWTLLILSTLMVKFSEGNIVHTAKPIMMMVCVHQKVRHLAQLYWRA
jgi:hypothetical protein